MVHRYKRLLGVLFVALAIGSFAAAAAQAEGVFTASSYAASVTGVQSGEHVLKVAGNTTMCPGATLSGELPAKSSQLTATPAYQNCETFSYLATPVTTNGCDYRFSVSSTLEAPHRYGGSWQIVCPAGKEIKVDAGQCAIYIPPQTINGVEFTTVTGTTNKVKVKTNTSSLHVTVAKESVFCGISAGAYTNAIYEGVSELSATSKGSPISFDMGME